MSPESEDVRRLSDGVPSDNISNRTSPNVSPVGLTAHQLWIKSLQGHSLCKSHVNVASFSCNPIMVQCNGGELRQRLVFKLCVHHFSHQEPMGGRWVLLQGFLLPKNSVRVVRVWQYFIVWRSLSGDPVFLPACASGVGVILCSVLSEYDEECPLSVGSWRMGFRGSEHIPDNRQEGWVLRCLIAACGIVLEVDSVKTPLPLPQTDMLTRKPFRNLPDAPLVLENSCWCQTSQVNLISNTNLQRECITGHE